MCIGCGSEILTDECCGKPEPMNQTEVNPCPKCGKDMGRKGYCTDERLKDGQAHFDEVRGEVLEERRDK